MVKRYFNITSKNGNSIYLPIINMYTPIMKISLDNDKIRNIVNNRDIIVTEISRDGSQQVCLDPTTALVSQIKNSTSSFVYTNTNHTINKTKQKTTSTHQDNCVEKCIIKKDDETKASETNVKNEAFNAKVPLGIDFM